MFVVRPHTGEPIYQQLLRQIKHAIVSGGLKPGEQLPTVRQLAAELVVNPNTVARAYRELEGAGLLESTPGRGSFVKFAPPRMVDEEREIRLQPFIDQVIAEARALGFGSEELVERLRKTLHDLPPPAPSSHP